jgi:6-phosphogluconate dehydrogenase
MSGECDFGVYGLGTMGAALALNVAERGHTVALFNRTSEKATELVAQHPRMLLRPSPTPAAFVAAIAPPRRILVMVPAGEATDAALGQLSPLLARGDLVADGGNAHWADTERRAAELAGRGLHWLGCGVSGGEEGARHGPSIMAGGEPDAYESMAPVLTAIAALSAYGPCVARVGPGGAGHFVKMVHNGIEYGVMQLIAETWDLLRRGLRLQAPAAAAVFDAWNLGPLESFLVELAARVLKARDPESGGALVDVVADAASQKGTGRWTIESALALGVPVPTLAAAVEARTLSSQVELRRRVAGLLAGPAKIDASAPLPGDADGWVDALHDALHAGMLSAYAQGLALVQAGSVEHEWAIDRAELARIWTGGCIIRARMLGSIRQAWLDRPQLEHLFLDPRVAETLKDTTPRLRRIVAAATEIGVPAPALSASLAYHDALRCTDLPTSLIQAQRDAFGAHTYTRTDHPERGAQHGAW